MNKIVKIAHEAALAAGKHLFDNFGKIDTIEQKGDASFVTNVDKETESIVVDHILKAFPDHGILAEEGATQNLDADYIWVVDPLDGTHNYIRSIPNFGVSIGLVHNKEIIAGVIYMPVQDEMYVASKGNGATKNNHKISVSTVKDLRLSSLCYDSTLKNNPKVVVPVLAKLSMSIFNCRMYGTTVRSLTYLAEGKFDVVVEFDDKPWDFVAGMCIVLEAGGCMTRLNGSSLGYLDKGYVASNGIIHQVVLDQISEFI